MKLGEVCVNISVTFDKTKQQVVLVNTSDVLNGKVTNHVLVNNKGLKGQFKKTFQKDDILYSEIRPKNKRFAFIDFNANDYVASTKLMVIRANKKVFPQYLYQILKSDEVINQLQALAESRSGTFPQITFSELAQIDVRIPKLDEQKEIANFLKLFDDKIENNKKINHHLAAISKNYLKIFHSNNSIKLGDLFELKSGYAFKSKDWVDEGKPVIKIKDIDGITIDITNLNYVKNKSQLAKASNFEVFGKEIVMALTGATTGKIGVIPKNFKGYVNQRVGLFYAKTELSYAVLWSILQQQNIITDLIELSSGSAQANLSPSSVNSYDLNVTLKDLIELDKIISPLYELFCFNLLKFKGYLN